MNELGVNYFVSEKNAQFSAFEQETRSNSSRNMFTYQSELEIRWVDAANPTDFIEHTITAVAQNDDPAKAKGSAWTYAQKYYLFSLFSINMGLDPDDNPPAKNEKTEEEPKKPEFISLNDSEFDEKDLEGKREYLKSVLKYCVKRDGREKVSKEFLEITNGIKIGQLNKIDDVEILDLLFSKFKVN